MKNPDWKREELILALDLYFKMDYGQMHGRNTDVIRLSHELKRLNLHTHIADTEKFRSVNSVSLKLANFKKLDQNFSGIGMRDGGRLDREVWTEFHRHRDSLGKEADVIRHLYLRKKTDLKDLSQPEGETRYSSEFLYRFHKSREKDPLLLKLKKEQKLSAGESLQCEICRFDSYAFYGEMGAQLMEIHYNSDTGTPPSVGTASVDDFIIICSNCHKVLDKHFGLITSSDLKTIVGKR